MYDIVEKWSDLSRYSNRLSAAGHPGHGALAFSSGMALYRRISSCRGPQPFDNQKSKVRL